MAQSPEFPQYPWIPPKSYTPGRKSGQPTVIVIHTTEGSEGPNSAEDGAAYDQRRADGTSAHFYIDSNTAVQCVRTTDEAHTAAGKGNDIGIHLELCGRAGQSAAQWADPVSAATVANAAEVCRTLLGKYPSIPVVRLTPTQLQNGQRGFCGHVDITNAWHQTTHTDPGPNFPWSRLFGLIEEEHMEREEFLGHFRAAMDDSVARDRFERNTVTYPLGTQNLLTVFSMLLNDFPALKATVDLMATKVDIDPAELQAIQDAAREGAAAGAADAEAIAAAVVAELNMVGLTAEQEADVQRAVATVLTGGTADVPPDTTP